MKYVWQEFPKALYLNGVYAAVKDAEEEAAMRADGWTDWGADNERRNGVEARPVLSAAAVAAVLADIPQPTDAEADALLLGPAADIPLKRKPGRPPKAK